jgi:hypothetical protein
MELITYLNLMPRLKVCGPLNTTLYTYLPCMVHRHRDRFTSALGATNCSRNIYMWEKICTFKESGSEEDVRHVKNAYAGFNGILHKSILLRRCYS